MAESLGEAFIEILADTSPFGGSLSEGISEGLSGVEDEIASAFDGIDGVAANAFDGMTGEAEAAADGVSGAFDGVADDVQSSLDGISFDSISAGIEENIGKITAAGAGGAAAAEGFARSQQSLTEVVDRVSNATGEEGDSLRGLATDLSNATFPLEDVTALMETASQRGLEGADAIGEFATFWDKVGDATGEAGPQLGEASAALSAIGISAGEEEEALAAFGFITEQTTGNVGDFLQFIDRTGPELRELGLDVNDTAAFLGAMEQELGMSGRTARQEFRTAVAESDGDVSKLAETLGLTEEQVAEYTQKVGESSTVIDDNAASFAESRTPMQRMQSVLADVGFRFGAVSEIAGAVAAPLAAIGPAAFGISQGMGAAAKAGPALAKGLGLVSKAFNFLKVAILTNPLFLIGALIVGIVAVIWYFRDEIIAGLGAAWDWIRDTAGAVWEWLSETVSTAVDAVVEFVSGLRDRIVEFFTAMVDFVREYHPLAIAFRLVQEYVPQIITWIQDMVAAVVDTVQGWIDSVVELVTGLWQRWVELVQTIRDAVVETIVELVARVVETVSGWVESIVGFVQDLFARWVALQLAIRDAVVEAITNLVTTVATTVSGWVENIVGFVTDLWQRWVNLVHAIRDAVIAAVAALVANVVATVSGWVSSIVGFVTNLKDRWIRGMTNIRDQVIARVRNLVERVKSIVQEWIRRVIRFVEGLKTDFVGTMRKLVTDAVAKIRELPGKILDKVRNFGTLLKSAGRRLITGLISGITEKISGIGRAMSDAAAKVTQFWPFSPAKEGPLRDHSPEDAGANIIGLMAGGMAANIDQIAAQARAAAEAALVDATGGTLRVDAPGQARGRRPAEVDPAGTRSDGARGEMVVNQTIYTADPRKAAQESIRKLRDAAYLGGDIGPVGEAMRRG